MKQNNLVCEPENLRDCNLLICDNCIFYSYRMRSKKSLKNPLLCEKRLELPDIKIPRNYL